MDQAHHVIDYIELSRARVAAVEAAGGTVIDGPYDFPGGRRFIFSDDSGNRLGVWATV